MWYEWMPLLKDETDVIWNTYHWRGYYYTPPDGEGFQTNDLVYTSIGGGINGYFRLMKQSGWDILSDTTLIESFKKKADLKGTSDAYARADHTHLLQLPTIPSPSDVSAKDIVILPEGYYRGEYTGTTDLKFSQGGTPSIGDIYLNTTDHHFYRYIQDDYDPPRSLWAPIYYKEAQKEWLGYFSSAPSNATYQDTYFDTSLSVFRYYSSGAWVNIGGTGYEHICLSSDPKGTSSEYARADHQHIVRAADIPLDIALDIMAPVQIKKDFGGSIGKQVMRILCPYWYSGIPNDYVAFKLPKPVAFTGSSYVIYTKIHCELYASGSSGGTNYSFDITAFYINANNTIQKVDYDYTYGERVVSSNGGPKIYTNGTDFILMFYYPYAGYSRVARITDIYTNAYFSQETVDNLSGLVLQFGSTIPSQWTDYSATKSISRVGTIEKLYPNGTYVITNNKTSKPDASNTRCFKGMTFGEEIALGTGDNCLAYLRTG
jgi:hypothetical protein